MKISELEEFGNWCDANYKRIEMYTLEQAVELFREDQQGEWVAYAW